MLVTHTDGFISEHTVIVCKSISEHEALAKRQIHCVKPLIVYMFLFSHFGSVSIVLSHETIKKNVVYITFMYSNSMHSLQKYYNTF